MVDPSACTNYDRSQEELEEFALFAVLVAGKTAFVAAKALDRLLDVLEFSHLKKMSPLQLILATGDVGSLAQALQTQGIGCFRQKALTLWTLAEAVLKHGLDLRGCGPEALEAIAGIGPKTSRFFLLHTRRGVRVAALDRHVLSYLRERGHPVPKSTPPAGIVYARLEKAFLTYAKEAGMTAAAFDLAIWNAYSSRAGKPRGK